MANPKVEAFLKKLKDLPKGAKAAIVLAPSAVAAALLGFLLIYPQFGEIKKIEAELKKLESEINDKQAKADKLNELVKLNAELKTQLDVMSKQLPEAHETTILLGNVAKLAKDSDLNITSWKPAQRKEHPSKIVEASPVSIALNATYHSLGLFFGRLTALDRIVNITDLSFSSIKDKETETSAPLSVSLSAVTYSAVEALTAEAKAPVAGGAKTAPQKAPAEAK